MSNAMIILDKNCDPKYWQLIGNYLVVTLAVSFDIP